MKPDDVPAELIRVAEAASIDFLGTPSNAVHALSWDAKWKAKDRALRAIIADVINAHEAQAAGDRRGC